jgi:hypothetical protein
MIKADAPATSNRSPEVRVTAVCISRDRQTWHIPSTPFYNYTDGWKPFHHEKTIERVRYLAERRNTAVAQALDIYPQTEHILMIDSYYLSQEPQIKDLMEEYRRMSHSHHPIGCILGASTWVLDKTSITRRIRFYDNWTTPEGSLLNLRDAEEKGGIIEAKAVGGCYLYPRPVWEKTHYDVPMDLHGCEHNWLCENSGLPVFLSLNQRLWHDPVEYGWSKRVRVSLHLGRFLAK